MKITAKGQVTIPQDIRERAGFLPHTEVEFKISRRHVILVKAPKTRLRGERLVKALAGAGTVKLSTDEILALTRGE